MYCTKFLGFACEGRIFLGGTCSCWACVPFWCIHLLMRIRNAILRKELRTHTLRILCTELKAVPLAGLKFHFLRVQVMNPKRKRRSIQRRSQRFQVASNFKRKTPIERTTRWRRACKSQVPRRCISRLLHNKEWCAGMCYQAAGAYRLEKIGTNGLEVFSTIRRQASVKGVAWVGQIK